MGKVIESTSATRQSIRVRLAVSLDIWRSTATVERPTRQRLQTERIKLVMKEQAPIGKVVKTMLIEDSRVSVT